MEAESGRLCSHSGVARETMQDAPSYRLLPQNCYDTVMSIAIMNDDRFFQIGSHPEESAENEFLHIPRRTVAIEIKSYFTDGNNLVTGDGKRSDDVVTRIGNPCGVMRMNTDRGVQLRVFFGKLDRFTT